MRLRLPKILTNPGSQLFGSGYNPSRDIGKSYLQQMGNLSGAYQNRLARSQESVQRFDPMYQAAVRTRLNYLQQQPFAAEQDALTLGRASGTIADQYGQAQGNLARMLASRGIGGGVEAGALANLESNRMGQRAGMQYQTALARIAARNQAQQEALGLLGGARSMYAGEEASNLAGLQGLYGNLYQGYSGVGAQEAADKTRGQQMFGQLMQAAAQAYGASSAQPTSSYGGQMQAQPTYFESPNTPVTYGPDGLPIYYGDQGGMQTMPTRATPRRGGFANRMIAGLRF
jgi:hypothetical protein